MDFQTATKILINIKEGLENLVEFTVFVFETAFFFVFVVFYLTVKKRYDSCR